MDLSRATMTLSAFILLLVSYLLTLALLIYQALNWGFHRTIIMPRSCSQVINQLLGCICMIEMNCLSPILNTLHACTSNCTTHSFCNVTFLLPLLQFRSFWNFAYWFILPRNIFALSYRDLSLMQCNLLSCKLLLFYSFFERFRI